jgi:molecular chaperone DnaK (HSP70)
MSAVTIGLDVGGYNYAAAYVPDDNEQEQPISIPLFPQDIEVRNAPVACRLPMHLIATEVADFFAMKQEIDRDTPFVIRRDQSTMHASDWITSDLNRIRAFAEDYIGQPVERAVISVAAQYPGRRRSLLRKFALNAGFREVELINDGTAAAMGYLHNEPKAQTVLIYSSGYSLFEASLLRVVKQHYRELGHEGATAPSGKHFDEQLMKAVLDKLRQAGSPLPVSMWSYDHWFTFQYQIEAFKKQLSVHDKAVLELSGSLAPGLPPVEYSAAELMDMIKPSVAQSFDLIDRLLEDADLSAANLDTILLVGNSTRIELIQQRVAERFKLDPVPYEDDLLARGAAIYGRRLAARTADTDSATSISVPVPSTSSALPQQEPPEAPAVRDETSASSAATAPAPDVGPVLRPVEELLARGELGGARDYLDALQARIDDLKRQVDARS